LQGVVKDIPSDHLPDSVKRSLAETIAELEAAGTQSGSTSETVAQSVRSIGDREPFESEGFESLSAEIDTDRSEFMSTQDEIEGHQSAQKHLEATERPATQHVEAGSVDCQWLPAQAADKSQPVEPQLDCLEFGEQPHGDTSGLPALPIA